MSSGDGRDPFTPTQRRILDVLKDGMPHKRDEVRMAVDELASKESLNLYLTAIRKKIRPSGYDIICQLLNHTLHYRIIRVAVLHWPAGAV